MKKLSLFAGKAEKRLNDLSLRKKLRYLYYFCILVPIILTDTIILYSLVSAEQAEREREMGAIASSVQYQVTAFAENSALVSRSIYMDDSIQEFLNTQFERPSEYVSRYQDIMHNSLTEGIMGIDNTVITVYADNDTIVNGGGFIRLSEVTQTDWYRRYKERFSKTAVLFYYDSSEGRKALFLRSLNRPLGSKKERFVKIEMDYSALARSIINTKYSYPVYICCGDEVLISNSELNNLGEDFFAFTLEEQVGLETDFTLYGAQLRVCVLKKTDGILAAILDNILLFALLLLFNIFMPQILMNLIEHSITDRIFGLEQVFEQVNSDTLLKIPGEEGKDEIGSLICNYNRMADRMNGLIQMVYRDQLKKQEMYIARQKAELLALYSQINPHFLFNALESIRMHSILKGEQETADMVQKLAVMERQTVDWSADLNTVKKEMEFVEAYLSLQKYRFGERLSYRIETQPECENILIPKLTITTFVENACVHGIESKTTPGWIFVRICSEEGCLCIEVEDTGVGMDEEEAEKISCRMRNASIDMLKEKGRIGMVNVCLRLRMMTEDTAQFSVESETGVGTIVTIRIPLARTERAE